MARQTKTNKAPAPKPEPPIDYNSAVRVELAQAIGTVAECNNELAQAIGTVAECNNELAQAIREMFQSTRPDSATDES